MIDGESIPIIRANISRLEELIASTSDLGVCESAKRLLAEHRAQLIIETERHAG